MPRGDGTGPDGKGPRKTNKGWPARDGRGLGQGGRGRGRNMGGGHSERNPEGGGTRRMSRTTKIGGSGA